MECNLYIIYTLFLEMRIIYPQSTAAIMFIALRLLIHTVRLTGIYQHL